ncbi:MAG TPA: hypothetical protein VLQ48_02130 [Chloroflexia bacterium]|nr:hypothetical protein [Chloroflexia bacterium]
MSIDIIKLIPSSPEYVPDALAQERAVAFLKSLLLPNPDPSSEITTEVTEHVEFIDQGTNFERIVCPFCEAELTIEWWHEVMDKAYEERFGDLSIAAPCCHIETSLNDLQYEWPAGFARFVLKLYEPFSIDSKGVYQMLELSEDMLEKLQDTLGSRLRIIWAHY